MTTLEAAVSSRMQEFKGMAQSIDMLETRLKTAQRALDKAKDASCKSKAEAACAKVQKELHHARRADEEQIEYLLNALPFIREYALPQEKQEKPAMAPTGIAQFVDISQTSNKNEVLTKYLAAVEGDEGAMQRLAMGSKQDNEANECAACGNRLLFHADESMLCCESCGMTLPHFEGSSRNLSYDEEIAHSTRGQFCYKKFNHLLESLNSIQGKENTTIPDDVISAIKTECKKHRLVSKKDIVPAKVRQFLKQLGLSKYYEHVNHITNIINGVPPPRIKEEVEEKLKQMFLAIQKPFEKHCPPERKNFLKYGYVLYKCAELIGADDILHLFPLLKSKEKMYQHDQVWRLICQELDWEFIATV